jgi:hypothetical protein
MTARRFPLIVVTLIILGKRRNRRAEFHAAQPCAAA